MADELERLRGVASVTTVLDVPLLESPPLSLTDLARADSIATLRDPEVDRELALKELTTSPVYRNLLVSERGDLTAVQVSLQADELAESLLDEREAWRRSRRIMIWRWQESALSGTAWLPLCAMSRNAFAPTPRFLSAAYR
jgi:hypothetical protein